MEKTIPQNRDEVEKLVRLAKTIEEADEYMNFFPTIKKKIRFIERKFNIYCIADKYDKHYTTEQNEMLDYYSRIQWIVKENNTHNTDE